MEQPEAKSKGGPWSRLTMPQAVVLAALIIAAAMIFGNRYTGLGSDSYVLDRLTGDSQIR
jgi:hypothetical protein